MPDTPKPNHPCGNCAFNNESIWQPVEEDAVSVLSRGFSRKDLDEDQLLYEQGAENRGVFCVSKGLIALRSFQQDGSSVLLRLAYPGEVIGFRSFLGNGKHQTEARALMPSRVCTVARRDAQQIIRGCPSVLARLSERCVHEIDQNHARIIATATTSNKDRLTDLLHRLMEAHGEKDRLGIRMRLPLSRSDLAHLIGVQPETMSRLVKRLEKEGEFLFSGREVRIPKGAPARVRPVSSD